MESPADPSPPRPAIAAVEGSRSRSATLALIGVVLILRLVWSATIGATNDEAYHYLYTVHPDLSFFDHPPMTMWVEQFGIAVCGGWIHPFSLRLGFVLFFAGSTWILARLTARRYGEGAGFCAALLFNVTAYFAGAGGFVLPDPPFVFFSLLTLAATAHAVLDAPQRTLPWVVVGIAFAGAMLSKYLAVFLPAGTFVFLLLTPSRRRLLLRPGPYLAVAIGLIGFAPVLVWNAQHGWESLLFQGKRAAGLEISPEGIASYLFGPLGYLFPWIWLPLMASLFGGLRRFRERDDAEQLFLCLAAVPLAAFAAISIVKPILPHWMIVGFLPLYPLAGAVWAKQREADPDRWRKVAVRMASFAIGLLCLVAVQARFGILPLGNVDPLQEASGWDSVGAELESRGLVGIPRTYIITTRWHASGQVAFAIRNKSPVVCFEPTDARGFAFWSKPRDWLGWDAILVSLDDHVDDIDYLKGYFARHEPIAEFRMMRGSNPFRQVRLWRMIDMKEPFPFGNGDPKNRVIE